MSVIPLPGGKYRVQIRRKNLQLDEVFSTEAEAKDAEEVRKRAILAIP